MEPTLFFGRRKNGLEGKLRHIRSALRETRRACQAERPNTSSNAGLIRHHSEMTKRDLIKRSRHDQHPLNL